jgi:hypothetical protein
VSEALTYRNKIAELAFDFIKDDSVVGLISVASLRSADSL